MANVYLHLPAQAAIPPASNAATLATVNLTASSDPLPVLAFDAGTDEAAHFVLALPDYASGNPTLAINWTAASATSGDVIWAAQLLAVTPNTDSGALSGEAFATANTVTDTHLGTNAGRVMTTTITISNLDSLTAGDLVILKIYRDADAGGDTMTGDAYLVDAVLTYANA